MMSLAERLGLVWNVVSMQTDLRAALEDILGESADRDRALALAGQLRRPAELCELLEVIREAEEEAMLRGVAISN